MKPILSTKITRRKQSVGDYVPSGETNVALTIRRIKREQKAAADAERAAEVEARAKVRTLLYKGVK